MNRYSVYVGRRVSLRGRNRVASVIACAGVAVAVAVMVITLSVSVGFKQGIVERLSGFVADVTVTPPYDYAAGRQDGGFSLEDSLLQPYRATRLVRVPAILKVDGDYMPVVLNGVDAENAFVRRNIREGAYPEFADTAENLSVVVSRDMAARLGLGVGDRVSACFMADDNVRLRRLRVKGIYASDFSDYDAVTAYASPAMLRGVRGMSEAEVTDIEIRGVGVSDAPAAAKDLQDRLVARAIAEGEATVPVVDDITRSGAMYLGWLDLLDTNVVVIFALMCCVAACALVSSLFILVLNNITAIGLLRSLGATRRGVADIFVWITMRIVGLGMLFGNIFAVLLIWVQRTWAPIPLDPQMYYLSAVPMAFNLSHILLINAGVAVLAWALLIVPSRIAARVSPASTMRFE